MHRAARFAMTALLIAWCLPASAAAMQTVCTVTVNSPDEKQAFERYLPADRYRFVELVEHGRDDWLDAACRSDVQCDILIVSGHYDGGHEFFSDRVDAREYLPVSELERASCSDSCPGLFARLKEVYLFGCNTLNADARQTVPAEIARGLVRGGMARADAERTVRALALRHGASARDRMRQVFKDVPAIYGFSGPAPLGPVAAGALDRYFRGGNGSVGSGRANGRLLSAFAANGMTVTRGIGDADAAADVRRDVCQFVDARLSPGQRTRHVHELLQRPMPEVRMFLDRLERYAAARHVAPEDDPDLAREETALARDEAARARFLAFARAADDPSARARMIALAGNLHWLTRDERRTELARMIGEIMARNAAGPAEVDLVCRLDRDGDFDGGIDDIEVDVGEVADSVGNSALRACLGDGADRTRMLEALVGDSAGDAQIAQAYLRYQPIEDPAEMRTVVADIARMADDQAQARALAAIGRHRLSDPESLATLTRLFPAAPSGDVQRAIAGVLIRADYAALARPELVRTLQESRRRSPQGDDVIDALIRRLQMN
jgi:hypothetical protein